MSTTRERLQATLAELQSELAELGELDSTTRERLQATLGDIVAALARTTDDDFPRPTEGEPGRSQSGDTAPHSLAERLNDATRGLESTHPELSTTLGSVINALAQMGI
jgi:hypothetical protein